MNLEKLYWDYHLLDIDGFLPTCCTVSSSATFLNANMSELLYRTIGEISRSEILELIILQRIRNGGLFAICASNLNLCTTDGGREDIPP